MAPKRETAQEIWGNELAHALEAAGMTGRELAEMLNVVPSTVSNWINGKRTPHVDDIERIEDKLGTNGYLRRDLKWVQREISPEWFEWRGVEEDSTTLLTYETRVVPGLLQTPEYARTILPAEKAEERRDRQGIFEHDVTPFFEALIDESILYRKVGTAEIMTEQLGRLIASRDQIVRVVPFSADIKRFTLSFVLATLDSGKQVAYLDSALRGRITERPSDIAELWRFWGEAGAAALSQEASIDLIHRTIEDRWSTK
ncbi:helix-turn-helix domain-containing protein [Actinomadura rubrisoli]|uniref:XRE family transcriptional regulator n=1 Tax=Actinomadura rubrisoli TaxID=2530368 RepID=A0A4R5A2C8_9ACTN|nr:helix-turn-helix transcriptional regulator [Actinomadura rubrisoli]TDD65110.1 XRE family transcriptional regulator [Actinomadura rubrisoli]